VLVRYQQRSLARFQCQRESIINPGTYHHALAEVGFQELSRVIILSGTAEDIGHADDQVRIVDSLFESILPNLLGIAYWFRTGNLTGLILGALGDLFRLVEYGLALVVDDCFIASTVDESDATAWALADGRLAAQVGVQSRCAFHNKGTGRGIVAQ